MATTTATETTTTAIDLTPDTLQAIARLISAVEKISLALNRMDKTITALAAESVKQTVALEQIQMYQSDRR
jgi:hypothetical protein